MPKHFSGVPFFCLLLIGTDWGGGIGEGAGGWGGGAGAGGGGVRTVSVDCRVRALQHRLCVN